MSDTEIRVLGARANNLKGINCRIPRNSLVVVAGPSGSGKSSLVYDTVYRAAEQRFLLPAVSLPELNKRSRRVEVDAIEGLSFASWISGNPRKIPYATVASYSGIYRRIVSLFVSAGSLICKNCGQLSQSENLDGFVERVLGFPRGTRVEVLFGCGVLRKDQVLQLSREFAAKGFSRIAVNKENFSLGSHFFEQEIEEAFQEKASEQTFLLVDEFRLGDRSRERIYEALLLAKREGKEQVIVRAAGDNGDENEIRYADGFICPCCGLVEARVLADELRYDSPSGWCPECRGLGMRRTVRCGSCGGLRLGERPKRLKLGGRTFCEVFQGTIQRLCSWKASLQDEIAPHAQQVYLKKLSKSIEDLAGCLMGFGLGYLELSRDLSKLSSGERSRLHLAREVSDGLSGVLFCIDEPSAGLHPLDCEQMLAGMKKLLARGSTLLAIEHDPLIISGADHLIRLGPGSGPRGGEVVYEGVPQGAPPPPGEQLLASPASVAGQSACELVIEGANKNNLRNLSLKVPLGQLVCVCGVSGSGKSSLIIECLYPALKRLLAREIAQSRTLEEAEQNEFGVKEVSGSEFLSRVALPGVRGTIRSGRSTSATLGGILGELRQLYASTLDARVHGLDPNSFSFNSERGWCPSCRGLGEVDPRGLGSQASCYPCEVCGGKRYAPKILSVKYKGFSIADTLQSSVDELCLRFKPIPSLFRRLSLMQEIGLGYLHMDQPVGGLSRGERQRLALVSDLCRLNSWDRVLFLLDEPTSGLGQNEVMQLQRLFKRMVCLGASVVVIEHNAQFLSHADYLIELGPGPGVEGGSLLAAGPPAEIASCATSLIRRFLGTALI